MRLIKKTAVILPLVLALAGCSAIQKIVGAPGTIQDITLAIQSAQAASALARNILPVLVSDGVITQAAADGVANTLNQVDAALTQALAFVAANNPTQAQLAVNTANTLIAQSEEVKLVIAKANAVRRQP